MSVYLGRDWNCVTVTVTETHATASGLITKIENLGHKLYVDNLLSSPGSYDDLHMKAINCYGTVTSNQKGTPGKFGKDLRLKQGDVKTKAKGDLPLCFGKIKET
jgi:hypothetical protein